MKEFSVAKGMKDWYGKDAILRIEVRDVLRRIFELYGYNPIETPLIENKATLGFKGGGEIHKEVFTIGGHNDELALRFDQTVPLARFYASHQELKLPFKRYTIGEVFRDGPINPLQGRYRSFTQCDIDVLGIKAVTAEMELFCLSRDVFQALALGDVTVRINNKKVLDGILAYAQIPIEMQLRSIITIDKLDKIGMDGVITTLSELKKYDPPMRLSNELYVRLIRSYEEGTISSDIRGDVISEIGLEGFAFVGDLLAKNIPPDVFKTSMDSYINDGGPGLSAKQLDKLVQALSISGNNSERYDQLRQLIPDNLGLDEIEQILSYSDRLNLDIVAFEPSLARGLDYYTGTTLEVYLKDSSIIRSAIAAGGRFDKMVGDFRGLETEIPAVGMSFGLERLCRVIEKSGRELHDNTTELYLIPIGNTMQETFAIAQDLRSKGLCVDIVHEPPKKVGEAVGYASKAGIPYVGFIGEDEIQSNSIMLKNLATGKQEAILQQAILSYIRK